MTRTLTTRNRHILTPLFLQAGQILSGKLVWYSRSIWYRVGRICGHDQSAPTIKSAVWLAFPEIHHLLKTGYRPSWDTDTFYGIGSSEPTLWFFYTQWNNTNYSLGENWNNPESSVWYWKANSRNFWQEPRGRCTASAVCYLGRFFWQIDTKATLDIDRISISGDICDGVISICPVVHISRIVPETARGTSIIIYRDRYLAVHWLVWGSHQGRRRRRSW